MEGSGEVQVLGGLGVVEKEALNLGVKRIRHHDCRRGVWLWVFVVDGRGAKHRAELEVPCRVRSELEAQELTLGGVGSTASHLGEQQRDWRLSVDNKVIRSKP